MTDNGITKNPKKQHCSHHSYSSPASYIPVNSTKRLLPVIFGKWDLNFCMGRDTLGVSGGKFMREGGARSCVGGAEGEPHLPLCTCAECKQWGFCQLPSPGVAGSAILSGGGSVLLSQKRERWCFAASFPTRVIKPSPNIDFKWVFTTLKQNMLILKMWLPCCESPLWKRRRWSKTMIASLLPATSYPVSQFVPRPEVHQAQRGNRSCYQTL